MQVSKYFQEVFEKLCPLGRGTLSIKRDDSNDDVSCTPLKGFTSLMISLDILMTCLYIVKVYGKIFFQTG